MTIARWRALTGMAGVLAVLWPASVPQSHAQTAPRSEVGLGVHLGVATCLGSNCHGAVDRPAGSAVQGNEYVIWSTRDTHHDAYRVLTQERAIRMAKAVGLPDAVNQKICLDCHADSVPVALRGPQFHLEDGVGCEACHGGASGWLGIHISGASHQDNLRAGLYPTDDPQMRAERCLGCHFGDATRFVDHRLIAAGHPRLPFELDTFTALQPAHFRVTENYIRRKGLVTDVQVWAAGQALQLAKRAAAITDPKRSREGIFPEFALFDCESCHHEFDSLHAPRPNAAGLGPGTVKLDDANAVMLHVATARVDPAAARALSTHLLALDRASNADWPAAQREAAALRETAMALAPALARHRFSRDDLRAMANAVIALGIEEDQLQYAHVEQFAFALQSLRSAMLAAGYLSESAAESSGAALKALQESFPNGQSVHRDAFVKALRQLRRALGS